MNYPQIKKAVFIDRPNPYTANVQLDGKHAVCHIKSAGRSRELLAPGVRVLVQDAAAPGHKPHYNLIAVWKGGRLINIDADAPGKVFGEWLAQGGLGFTPNDVQHQYRHGDVHFDFSFDAAGRSAFAEVKGVTLEEGGVVRFPETATTRAVRNIHALTQCARSGYDAYAVFVVQMRDVKWFEPNWAAQSAYGNALRQARDAGVRILALDCDVTENSLSIRGPVATKL
jgi:sugar fermentation stimulation protein